MSRRHRHQEEDSGPIRRATQRLVRAPPVLLERLALPGVDGHALRIVDRSVLADDDSRGGVILCREDVARHPAHVGAELDERLDEHCGLHGHVQRAHDLRAGERLLALVLAAQRHQARHLVLGETDLLASEFGQGDIGDLEGHAVAGHRKCGPTLAFFDSDLVGISATLVTIYLVDW